MIMAPASYCNGPPIPKRHPEKDEEDQEDCGEDGRQGIVPDDHNYEDFGYDDHGLDEDEEKGRYRAYCALHILEGQ